LRVEKSKVATQQSECRFEADCRWIREHRRQFARSGSVVATWRTRNGRRVGPYYRVEWREHGRRRSRYLGANAEAAQKTRALLAELQLPRDRQRANGKLRAEARRELRRSKAMLALRLRACGLWLKGFEFRGWSRVNVPVLAHMLAKKA
jgi:hypothetical protein